MPKSATLMEPSCRSMMFWGLMSRWMMPFSWAHSRAMRRVMPSINSMTMYWIWSPKLTSYTLTMLGWLSTAMALDSLRKRRRKSLLLENSSFKILMATQRPSTRS